jgi:hypothetical protein
VYRNSDSLGAFAKSYGYSNMRKNVFNFLAFSHALLVSVLFLDFLSCSLRYSKVSNHSALSQLERNQIRGIRYSLCWSKLAVPI